MGGSGTASGARGVERPGAALYGQAEGVALGSRRRRSQERNEAGTGSTGMPVN